MGLQTLMSMACCDELSNVPKAGGNCLFFISEVRIDFLQETNQDLEF